LNRKLLQGPVPILVAALAISVAIWAAVALGSALTPSQPGLIGKVGGAPPYAFNQPFLDWPQAGDLPCEKEFGPCGTSYPTLDPATKALGTPLRIASLKVDVGTVGRHELEIGTLAFARGIHTRTTFRIVNGDEKVSRVAQTHVEFRSLVAGAPAFGEFAGDRAPRPGIEPVAAILVWTVDFAVPGAVMEIVDLVVE
jgi:hypothetical protein